MGDEISASVAIITVLKNLPILFLFPYVEKDYTISRQKIFIIFLTNKYKTLLQDKITIHMNKTSLAITALAIVAATAIGLVTTQSAAAQALVPMTPPPTSTTNSFNTDNAASQSSTQSAAAASGGASGGTGLGGTGGISGSVSISQGVCQQIAQSGAFGISENEIENSDCS